MYWERPKYCQRPTFWSLPIPREKLFVDLLHALTFNNCIYYLIQKI